jgi:3D (Asp-Asp-Asp) domain-containing protein
VRGRIALSLARFGVLCGGVALALTGATATAADSADGYLRKADTVRRQATGLGDRRQQALLSLYSLQTKLAFTYQRLSTLDAQAAQARSERRLVRTEVRIARRSLRISERRLAIHLISLYEAGDRDPLAVLLGATSLDEALTSLDTLNRTARQSRNVAARSRAARLALSRLESKLAARADRLTALAVAARRSAAALEQARAEHAALVAQLRSKEQLGRHTIALLEHEAAAATAKSQQLTAPAAPADPTAPVDSSAIPPPAAAADPPPAPVQGRTIIVSATGYAIRGRTGTGIPTGWGVVAVDPSVIPLGTRMTIPGYGEAVAADTGGSIHGATLDLWFPSLTQALAWGRRTVTITLH